MQWEWTTGPIRSGIATYGSILVNLHTGKAIDLLPDREAETLHKWLETRPEIEVMSRDRYSNYQKAITTGAPQAIQVTDRWHLLKNLGDAVQKVLVRQYSKVNAMLAEKHIYKEPKKAFCGQPIPGEGKSSDEHSQGGIRLQRFKQLKALQGKGHSIRAMARHLNMSRRTIRTYLDMETLPRKSQSRERPIESFFPYIKGRMEEESDILLTTLWQELKCQGYTGAYTTLSDAFRYYGIRVGKKAGRTKKLPPQTGMSFKPASAAIWFVTDQDKLKEGQQKMISELCTSSKDLQETFTLAQSFRKMMAKRSGNTELKKWIDKSTKSRLKEIASFAKGLLKDY